MHSNNTKSEVFSGLIWKFSERIIARGVEFFISLILARILSPKEYGLITMVLVFITIADVFVSSGFATALIQKKDADNIDFSTMFYSSLFCSIIIYCIIFFSAPLISKFYHEKSLCLILRIFGLRIPLSVYNSIQHAYVSRNMLFKRFFWSTLFGTLISGIVGIALALSGAGVWALIAQYFTNIIIDTLVLAITVPWHPDFIFSFKAARPLMAYGGKILAADLSGTFFGQLRNLIIGRYYTSVDLAYYNKGQQFPNLLYTNLASAVMSVLFPAMSNTGDNIEMTKQITKKAMSMLTYTITPLMLGMAAIAKPLILFLLTDKWLDAVPYLQILCVDYAIASAGIAPFQALKALGKSDIVLKLEFVKKPIYLILLIIGVKVNVLSIAVTMVIYELYGTIINSFQISKYLNYSLKEQFADIFPSILSSTIMAVLVYVVNISLFGNSINLILKVIIGVVIYIVLSKLFKLQQYVVLLEILRGLRKRGRNS